VEHLKGALLG
jgi:hypothetical protein